MGTPNSASSTAQEAQSNSAQENNEGKIQVEWGGIVYTIPVDQMPAMLASLGHAKDADNVMTPAVSVTQGASCSTADRSAVSDDAPAATGPGRPLAPLEAARSVEEAIMLRRSS